MINKLDNRFLLIGIGVFFYLFITTYAFLFQDWTRLLAINFTEIPPVALFFFIQIVYLSTIILFSFLFQSKLKNEKTNSKKLFIQLAIWMVVGQCLQFVTYFIFDLIETSQYLDRLVAYSEAIRNEYALGWVSPGLSLIVDFFLIYFFYKNRNSILNLDAKTYDFEKIGT